MKSRPILFSGSMVRAILDGSKTQTRRIVKGAESKTWHDGQCGVLDSGPIGWNIGGTAFHCPYGRPVDQLWIRETHAFNPEDGGIVYRATDPSWDNASTKDCKTILWKPSIFCRREYSRITLEITAIRVERLNQITATDAIAEGIEMTFTDERTANLWWDYQRKTPHFYDPVESYQSLWESINGPGSWDKNPFVWVVEFKRIQP